MPSMKSMRHVKKLLPISVNIEKKKMKKERKKGLDWRGSYKISKPKSKRSSPLDFPLIPRTITHMKRILTYILVILSTILLSYSISGFASTLEIPGADIISENSILVTTTGTDATEITQSFGLKILGLLKIVISGFALIFMVMIGAYMVIFSENEERIKTQRRQIVYVLVAFLFLNIPGFVYDVLSPADAGGVTLVSDTWTLKMIWYQAGIPGFV